MGPQGFQNPKFQLGEFRPLHMPLSSLLLNSKFVKGRCTDDSQAWRPALPGGKRNQRGRVTVKVLPAPGLLAHSTLPRCDSAIHLTMARPRPKPPSWRERASPAR